MTGPLAALAQQHAEARIKEILDFADESRDEEAYLLDAFRALLEILEGEVRALPACEMADVLALLARWREGA